MFLTHLSIFYHYPYRHNLFHIHRLHHNAFFVIATIFTDLVETFEATISVASSSAFDTAFATDLSHLGRSRPLAF